MPAIHIHLCAAQREELRRHTLQRELEPKSRERLEIARRLADAGWNIPTVTRHLDRREATVRWNIKGFLAHGFGYLPDGSRPGRPRRVTDDRLVDQSDRTVTAPQLVDHSDSHTQVRIHPDPLGRLLRRRNSRWKRTERSVEHKPNPDLRAAMKAELKALKRSGPERSHRLVLLGPEWVYANHANEI